MPIFTYRALNSQGQEVKNDVEAATSDDGTSDSGDSDIPSTPDESPPDDDGSQDGTSDESPTEDDGSGDDTGAPPYAECSFNPAYQCAGPVDCTQYDCGGLNSALDSRGCLRLECEHDTDCGDGEVCHDPHAWGKRCETIFSCWDMEDGHCGCGSQSPILPCWIVYHCTGLDEFPTGTSDPEEYCLGLDRAACDGDPFGICLWIRVWPVLDAASCELEPSFETCNRVHEPGNYYSGQCGDFEATPIHYRQQAGGEYELTDGVFSDPYSGEPPSGWARCRWDNPGEPEQNGVIACDCACDPGLPP